MPEFQFDAAEVILDQPIDLRGKPRTCILGNGATLKTSFQGPAIILSGRGHRIQDITIVGAQTGIALVGLTAYCVLDGVQMIDCANGIITSPELNTTSGSAGQLVWFSNEFRSILIKGYTDEGINLTSVAGGSTQNLFQNIYINGGNKIDSDPQNWPVAGRAFTLGNCSAQRILTLNIEWLRTQKSAILLHRAGYIGIDAVHFEGVHAAALVETFGAETEGRIHCLEERLCKYPEYLKLASGTTVTVDNRRIRGQK